MNLNWKMKALAAAVMALAIAGCTTTKKPVTPVAPQQTQQQPDQNQGAQTNAADTSAADLKAKELAEKEARERAEREAADRANQAGAALNTRTFYFDYDSNAIQASDYDALKAHAAYLAKNSSAHVRVEGNADERGTREYNMALGERRAKAVAAFLTSNGASSSQLTVVSYGKEKPANDGHDEAAWSKNRRVELSYSANKP